ncbi:MAG: hypothetical protein WC492_05005 [Candidatus Micrarchaeia archaeon]
MDMKTIAILASVALLVIVAWAMQGYNANNEMDDKSQINLNAEEMNKTGIRGQPPQMRNMSAAEKEACNLKASGENCSISSPRGQMNGTCKMVSDALGCVLEFRGNESMPSPRND